MYAAQADNALSEQQALFSRDVQAEQAKEESQEKLMANIEGLTAPFAAEAIKTGGARLGARAFKKLGIKGGDQLARDIAENPNKALHTLFQKARTEATQRGNNALNQGFQDLQNRVLGGGKDTGNDLNFDFDDVPEETPRVVLPEKGDLQPLKGGDAFSDLKDELENTSIDENPFAFKNFTPEFDDIKSSPLSAPKATPYSANKFYDGESDPFKSVSGFDDIVDDIASGKSDLLSGLVKAQVRSDNAGSLPLTGLGGNKGVSPKILDLQQKTNLQPGNVLTQDSEAEIQGMVSKAPQVNPQLADQTKDAPQIENPSQAGSESTIRPNQAETESGGTNQNSNQQVDDEANQQAQRNLAEPIQSGEADEGRQALNGAVRQGIEAGTEDGQSAIQAGLKTALIANTGDLENPIGDVIEVGLGLATLAGSLFGTKTAHPTVAPPVVAQASTGFGIKAQ